MRRFYKPPGVPAPSDPIKKAPPTGLEPATSTLTKWRATLLLHEGPRELGTRNAECGTKNAVVLIHVLNVERKHSEYRVPSSEFRKAGPWGNRTPVAGVKDRCPEPLDEWTMLFCKTRKRHKAGVPLRKSPALPVTSAKSAVRDFRNIRDHRFVRERSPAGRTVQVAFVVRGPTWDSSEVVVCGNVRLTCHECRRGTN